MAVPPPFARHTLLLRARIAVPLTLVALVIAARVERPPSREDGERWPVPGLASGADPLSATGADAPRIALRANAAAAGSTPAGAAAGPRAGTAAPVAGSPLAAEAAFERRRADARLFLAGLYREFLGRAGDETAIALWADLIAAGTLTREQAVEYFLDTSPAFQAAAPLARLYLGAFQRAPDEAGWRHWRSLLVSGGSLDAVADAFVAGDEFAATHGRPGDDAFVALAVRNTLGREPTPAELAHWGSQLASGLLTRGGVLLAMTESPEFRAAVASEVDASLLYSALLGRSADLPGFSAWMRTARERGLTRAAMIAGFLDSPEYRARAATAGSLGR
ncbi:MAG: DUF4214 domain-containing protein [Burkholderiales bacterium]|nr:DUF4214 domain-containing protein [Burkholderiales bacterium]